ncbi:DNA endonuclease RBBP8 isoform X2 [Mastacembelus armatus]|uniref:DNA endonuclease RBBP8 isoform X2 n=1 Tax=Mastacembelus armatus TaxID=205130 RepID=UPI000E4573BC|nr:DNA endonuclease RBBP8 isoform X2 [Mastacembelus armatus]
MNSGSNNPAEHFEDLLTQLRLCHHKAIQELEDKVSKLKKERCLDAEKLEVFYVRNQQLREQNKALQEAIALLEGRLRAGACDRCATLEQDLKNNKDLNLHLVAKLQTERVNLEGGNRKVHSDLHRLTVSRSHDQQTSPAEEEEGIIPDSPILPSSVPVAKRLRKRRNNRNKPVCYGELPLPQSRHLLFNTDGAKDSGGTEVLVPNTCDLHTEISDVSHELKEATAETPEGLRDQETKTAQGAESSLKVPSKCDLHLRSSLSSTLIHSPGLTTERSPSLLPQTKWLSEHGTNNKAKRKKEQSEPEPDQIKAQRVQETVAKQKESNHTRPELTDQTCRDQSLIKKPLDNKAKKQRQEELVDTDCTWVSHSVLQGGQGQDSQPGLAEKAVDSLDMMFDNTTFGEYKTYDSSHEDQSQACDDDDEDDEDEEDYDHGPETSPGPSKARQPTFAYAAVVRKKDERRKLQGVTCRECESYYADLPEEQKQKKLSMCSRHRFLYVPPCTPENFWEVGFPSTQTCIEKGYIKEDDNQQARSRRRQPLNVLFSPKRNQQAS